MRRRPRTAEELANQVSLYFTYGSNLHIAQMAERCPDSCFVGRGTLTGYRWQINQRGVANIVESSRHDKVRGLVFEVTRADVRALDRFEGVRSGAYSRENLEVHVTANDALVGKKSAEVAGKLQAYHDGHVRRSSLTGRGTLERRKVPTWVYISTNHMQDGIIRPEYVPRMANAMLDARVLGVDGDYIKDVMAPPCRAPPAEPGASQPPPAVSQAPARPSGRTPADPAAPAPPPAPPAPHPSDTEGSHHSGVVGGVLRRLKLTRSREQRLPAGDRPPPPPSAGDRLAPGGRTLVERRSRANLVQVEPTPQGSRRVPAVEARARIDRERRPEEGAQPRRRKQQGTEGGQNDRGTERPTDDAGEASSTAPVKYTINNGVISRVTAATGESGTTAPVNASGTGTGTKRAATKADNGNTPRSTATVEGSASTTAATTDSAAAPKTKTKAKATSADTDNNNLAAPKAQIRANSKERSGDEAATAANGAAPTPKPKVSSTKTDTGSGDKQTATTGTGAATKTKTSTRTEGAGATGSTATTGTGAATKKATTKPANTATATANANANGDNTPAQS